MPRMDRPEGTLTTAPDYPMNANNPPASQAATIPQAFKDQVTKWYQQFLGRTPSNAELQSHYGNPSDYDGVYGAIANSKEANAYAIKQAAQATATTAGAGGDAGAMWDSIAAKAGIKDGGPGSGFADRAYWVAHPSEILNGRYAADVAGTGTDQPTGTPGSGRWQSSGATDRANRATTPAPTASAAPAAGAPSLADLATLANVGGTSGSQPVNPYATSATSVGMAQAAMPVARQAVTPAAAPLGGGGAVMQVGGGLSLLDLAKQATQPKAGAQLWQ